MPGRLDRLSHRLAETLAIIGLTVLIGFAAATVLDGLSRSLLSSPIMIVGDIGAYVIAAAIAACMPLAQLQRANITIDLVGAAIGPRGARALHAVAAILVSIVMIAIARQIFIYAADTASGGDSSVMLGIATAPFWYAVAVMIAFAAAAQILVAWQSIARISGA